MNERIQELAYQAEDYADGIVDQGGEFHITYTKKLAELIVKECANTVTDRCEMRGEGDVKRAEYHARRIKEHFGVE